MVPARPLAQARRRARRRGVHVADEGVVGPTAGLGRVLVTTRRCVMATEWEYNLAYTSLSRVLWGWLE